MICEEAAQALVMIGEHRERHASKHAMCLTCADLLTQSMKKAHAAPACPYCRVTGPVRFTSTTLLEVQQHHAITLKGLNESREVGVRYQETMKARKGQRQEDLMEADALVNAPKPARLL